MAGLIKNPTDQTVEMPGLPVPEKKLTTNDTEFLSFLEVGLFVTADGRYAVCVGQQPLEA